mgnify:CR=1 FL=1
MSTFAPRPAVSQGTASESARGPLRLALNALRLAREHPDQASTDPQVIALVRALRAPAPDTTSPAPGARPAPSAEGSRTGTGRPQPGALAREGE